MIKSISVLRKNYKTEYNTPMSASDYSVFFDEAMRQIHEEFASAGKEQEFLLWFRIGFISFDNGKLTLSVPTNFIKERFKNSYERLLANKLLEVSGYNLTIDYQIIKPAANAAPQTNIPSQPANQNIFANTQYGQQPVQVQPMQTIGQPVNSFNGQQMQSQPAAHQMGNNFSGYQNYNPQNLAQPVQPAQNVFSGNMNAQNEQFSSINNSNFQPQNANVQPKIQVSSAVKKHSLLNPSYTFSNFVMGENSSMAYNCAIAVAKNPGTAKNPLLIYGNVGLGKTHLMQAIGNEIYSSRGGKVIYVTAENFTNEFIESIREQTTQKFKAKYRTADVLLIDDIHFLQKKAETQEELFHTFNALYEANHQMVFTCDRPLSEIQNLSDRLRSRFGRGLSIDLSPPDYETRLAILSKKLESQNVKVSNEVLDLIAKNVATNVRDLESSLTTIVSYIEVTGQEITVSNVQRLLRDKFISVAQEGITIETIQKTVAESFGLSFVDLKGKKRSQNIVLPRHIAMYLAYNMEGLNYSTTEIGAEFGGRDHTTVMSGIEKIANLKQQDPTLETRIESLERKIRGI